MLAWIITLYMLVELATIFSSVSISVTCWSYTNVSLKYLNMLICKQFAQNDLFQDITNFENVF